MKIMLANCLAWLIPLFVQAQQASIHGEIKLPDGKASPNATVILKDSANIVLHFTRTNADGRFSFSLVESQLAKVAIIEVNHIGFEKAQRPIQSGKTEYIFQLEAAYKELPAVKIKNKPVMISKGDTLSYPVKTFSREEDRSIGDVLKRMPGITVDDEGKIYYNNKAISNLYTDGDNLMDGRYGLTTKIITKDMIQSVDVIQHHQPIEVLKGKVRSDDVAINLVLKDENSLSLATQAILGAGLPEQYDGTLNTVLLNKKIKLLNALRANNSGVDYRSDFAQLGNTSLLENLNITDPDNLLSSGTVSSPDLPKRNYYLNQSAVLNINQLFKNKHATQFKTNVQAFRDRQLLHYQSSTLLQTNADTANYYEQQQAITGFGLVQATLGLQANKTNYYIDNKISVQVRQEKTTSSLFTDRFHFGQHLLGKKYAFSNDFSVIPSLKNRAMMQLRWLLSYSNNPQELRIDTGLHQAILNQNLPYEETIQQASVPTFFSNISLAYQLPKGIITQNYGAGLITERQQLNTLLQLQQQNGSVNNYQRDAGNVLHWQRDRLFIQGGYSFRKPTFEMGITIPLIVQKINYNQRAYGLNKGQQQLQLNPSATIKWFLNKEDYVTFNYTYNNNPGNITGIYRGVVLTNYRSIHANDAELQQTNGTNARLYYNFQRSVIMLFMSAGIQYNRNVANFMYSSIITDSVQRVILLPNANTQQSVNVNYSYSKYLFSLGGTIGFKIMYLQGRRNQVVNGVLLPYNHTGISLISSWQGRLFRKVNFSYEASLVDSKSYQKANIHIETNMLRADQQLALNFSPLRKIMVQIKARHIYGKQSGVNPVNYLFTDANLRYTHPKWKTDFELDCSNLFGVKRYEIYRINANIASQSIFHIRSRMLLLRATFNM